MTKYNHDHGHEEHGCITLIDEQRSKTLYEILLTADGQEKFGKNCILSYPAGIPEDGDAELQAYSCMEDVGGTEGDLQQIETDAEWDMTEEVFNIFMTEEEE